MQHINKLLLIGEDSSVPDEIQTGLEQLGRNYLVEAVSNGTAALEKISGGTYKVLITRSFMQDMTGSNLARLAKQADQKLEIFLIAPKEAHLLHEEAFCRDIDHLIHEPVSVPQLQHLVETACRHSDQNNSLMEVGDAQAAGQLVNDYQPLFIDSDHPFSVGNQVHQISSGCPNKITTDSVLLEDKNGEAINKILEKMRHHTSSHCIMLLSSSGHIVDYSGDSQQMDITNVSTLIAANFMATYELAKLIGNDSLFKSTYHAGINYDVYSHALNEDYLLVSIFSTNTKVGLVRFGIRKNSAELLNHLKNNKFSVDFSDSQIQFGIENELDKLFMG